jgi:hypothetical protein
MGKRGGAEVIGGMDSPTRACRVYGTSRAIR